MKQFQENFRIWVMTLLLTLSLSSFVFADSANALAEETDWSRIDKHALAATKYHERSIPSLAAYLSTGAKSEMEKARAIFRWIASRISYDDDAYNGGELDSWTGEQMLQRRKGVCGNFAQLYLELGQAAGLNVRKLSGYAKGYGYTPGRKFENTNHAWNAFYADGRWHLADATWGEGYGKNVDGKLVSSKAFQPEWFDTKPEEFIFTHLPEEDKWQGAPIHVSKELFEKLPSIDMAFFELGFSAKSILRLAQQGKFEQYAQAYATQMALKVLAASPLAVVPAGQAFFVNIACAQCEVLTFINNHGLQRLSRIGDHFSGTIFPEKGSLQLAYGEKGGLYSTFLSYEVK